MPNKKRSYKHCCDFLSVLPVLVPAIEITARPVFVRTINHEAQRWFGLVWFVLLAGWLLAG